MIRKPKFEIGDVVAVKFGDEQHYGTITNCQYSNDPSRTTWLYNIGTAYHFPEGNITLVRKWNGEYPQPKERQNGPIESLRGQHYRHHCITHFFKINDEGENDCLQLICKANGHFINIKGEIDDHRNGDILSEDCEFYLMFGVQYKDFAEQVLSILQFAKRMDYYVSIVLVTRMANETNITTIKMFKSLNIEDEVFSCEIKCNAYIAAQSDDVLNTVLFLNE